MSKNKELTEFHEMELDDRILNAVSNLGWVQPTLIQAAAIPLLLEGKDVLLRARTGSGKTAAFALPLLQKVLNYKQRATEQCINALILSPSKELCHQTCQALKHLTDKCGKVVSVVDIANNDITTQRHILSESPDIVITTPTKVLGHVQSGRIELKHVETLVVDEADLIFSYGYEKDFKQLVKYLPPIYQAVLVSATITDDVLGMKNICLNNPTIIKLKEPEIVPANQLQHQRITIEENEKPAILSSLLKLRLVRGKSVIFVNKIDRCYRLKLFLEQFKIRSCVLNPELPSNIRIHTINQFNQGIYDYIIVSDEHTSAEKSSHGKRGDTESSAARGIDFHCVKNVINFDYPRDVSAYIHRAGRTARGNNKGCVLSFVTIEDNEMNELVESYLRSGYMSDKQIIKQYQFKLEEVQPFLYRAQDAWRAITRIAVHEARVREIKQEIFNSKRLKSYFNDNTRDLQVLRHDKPLKTVKVQTHLSDVPEYIVPKALKRVVGAVTCVSNTKRARHTYNSKAKAEFKRHNDDPLLSS